MRREQFCLQENQRNQQGVERKRRDADNELPLGFSLFLFRSGKMHFSGDENIGIHQVGMES